MAYLSRLLSDSTPGRLSLRPLARAAIALAASFSAASARRRFYNRLVQAACSPGFNAARCVHFSCAGRLHRSAVSDARRNQPAIAGVAGARSDQRHSLSIICAVKSSFAIGARCISNAHRASLHAQGAASGVVLRIRRIRCYLGNADLANAIRDWSRLQIVRNKTKPRSTLRR